MKLYEANISDLAKAFGLLAPRDRETFSEIAAMLDFELSEEGAGRTPTLLSVRAEAPDTQQSAPKRRTPTHERSSAPAASAGLDARVGGRAVKSEMELARNRRRNKPRWVGRVDAIEEDPIPSFPLRHEPLIPARWVRNVLADSLSTESEQERLDVEQLVQLIAQRKPFLRLPFLKARTLRRGVQVLVDVSAAMEPFKRDQELLIEEVIRVVGSDAVELAWFEHCPTRGVYVGDADNKMTYHSPRPGTTVLLLTDLGVGRAMLSSDAASEAEWISFAHETREAGCHMVCFIPYGRTSWPRTLRREMALVYWGIQTPQATAENGRLQHRRVEPDERDPRLRALYRRNPEAVELAKLLSLAARIEPELLRATRLRFLPHADAGTEADLWFSGLVQCKSSMALLLIPNIARQLREELLANDGERLERFWKFLQKYRADTGASNAIRLEEHISYIILHGREETQSEVETELRRALKALVNGGTKRSGLARWALSAIPLLPERARALPAAKQLLLASKLRLSGRAIPVKEISDSLKEVHWLLPSELPGKVVGIQLLEDGLEISDEPLPSMHRITVPETNPRVLELWADTSSERESKVVNWSVGESLTVELNGRAVSIRTIAGKEYYLKSRIAAGLSTQAVFKMKFSDALRSNSLDLSGMGLVELPGEILQLVNLRTLLLNNNALTELPERFTRLTRLQRLDLSHNMLDALPATIGRMNSLRTLVLADNRMAALHETVGRLKQLRCLDVTNNRLSSLPGSLRLLRRLEELYLHGNPELRIPSEVLGPYPDEIIQTGLRPTAPTAILDYYFQTRVAGRPLNVAKLILAGRGGVGKTSIVNRLVHNTFKDEKITEGIDITEWRLTVGKNRDDVRLNIWDFGGQEIMHATHQFFFTERSLYLLVLNGREGGEDSDAEYWLKLIQGFGGNSPVIVVLNKIKQHPFDLNRKTLQLKYPFIRDFIKTDTQDGTGIEELRRAVEHEVDNLEHLRDPFPATWFVIMNRLAGMKKNYLSFDEFRKECELLGEQDPQAQESLASYLHNLGIALNYKDNPRLQDTHVLNPVWMTNAIYNILNAVQIAMRKGEFRMADLPLILDKQDYPMEIHRFILALMAKFEMCFAFDGTEDAYLIPELLDNQPPSSVSEFRPEECLNFEYHYSVLPEGLLPRFIVRTHVLSDGTPRWRTGVILKLEGNLALVKGDSLERRVFINIKGPLAGRRRLLSVIRANLDRIHADIPHLQLAEIVPLPGHPGASVSYNELLTWEASGTKTFPKVVDGAVVNLAVDVLLNGVESESERTARRARAARVFVSYSHGDERLLNELQIHLSPLRRMNLIETWDEGEVEARQDWREKINENLKRADLFILLVSPNFIASDYCFETEFARALEQHAKNELRILPVIVRSCGWRAIPGLAELQVVPRNGKPVATWANKDSAWREVSEHVQAILEEVCEANRLKYPGR